MSLIRMVNMLPLTRIAQLLRCWERTVRDLVKLGLLPEIVPVKIDGKNVPHMNGFEVAAAVTKWVRYPQHKEYAIRTARKLRRAAEQARDAPPA
jgi:hypothetical protein